MIRKGRNYAGKGTYQLNKLEAALKLVPRKDTALDIGAHVGLWTRVLAHHFDFVMAFEMLPMHVECLRKNVEGMVNVTVCEPTALSNGRGMIGIQIEGGNSGNTRVSPAISQSDATVEMQLLDEVINPSGLEIDFIKIDVEGYELAVVEGGASTIKRCKPVMVVEQKPGNAERYGCKTGEVLDLLKSWGAKIEWEMSGDYCLRWE
jgi:FkbM family methyltransferase